MAQFLAPDYPADLHQIIYTSHSLVQMNGEDLVKLLEKSRHDNVAAGITGLLLHADGSFMQTIEGAFDAVQALFARIEQDPRHGGIILICNEPIKQRSYADWSMAFVEITEEQAINIPGFRSDQKDVGPLDRDLARNLMQTFFRTSGFVRRG